MAIKPKPYIPSFLKAALSGSRPIQLTFSEVVDTNIQSTSSFIYDPPGSPLKSSQQLNVDWSQFENHTFFMSAEAKTNLAFEQIINGYPFDGTRAEVEKFFENLTGFDKWIFEQFPKYKGALHFSGTLPGEDSDGTSGTWIQTKDYVGSLFPELSKRPSGESVLNPKNGSSMTIEMQLMIPEGETSGSQMICQKASSVTQGFSLYLLATGSSNLAAARFSVVSGSKYFTTDAELQKGKYNHIAVSLNRDTGTHYLSFYVNGQIVDKSKTNQSIDDMNIDASDMLIGTGSSITLGATTITPTQTLSGTMDEFRLFHSSRTTDQLKQYSQKSTFSSDELKLYYRFNEPAPPLVSSDTNSTNAIVIDSSGNALHALINNFFSFVDTDISGNITGSKLRIDASTDALSRMVYEQDETIPVLFPAYSEVVSLNTTLLTSGSEYDDANPNLITKLIPQHYLLEGAAFEGYDEPEGSGGSNYGGDGISGQGKLGGVQMLLSLLYIYARFFDEMKLYVDSFVTLNHVDYNAYDTVPNNFILLLIEQYGFHLPPLFNDATLEQYIRAENIDKEISVSEYPLRNVQNELLRRVLINLPAVIRSKGTQHSIKAFLRAVGIDPENSMRIREFGGPTARQLSYAREMKHEPGVMLEFVSSSLVTSPFLSASRVEPGYPYAEGNFVNVEKNPPYGVSDSTNDGLLTSGSWTVEAIVKWALPHINSMSSTTQSIARLMVTGSNDGEGGLVANLLAMSSSLNPKLALWVRPGTDVTSPYLNVELPLPSAGVFNGERWNVSFGCERNDSIGNRVSSSYFLRAATQEEGKITLYKATSSYFYEKSDVPGEVNAFRSLHSASNASGSYISIGKNLNLLSGSGTGYVYLSDVTNVPSEARELDMTGLLSNLRFWSKALTVDEWKEHVRNFKSLGVKDPLTNYNFVKTKEGSFERVRLDSIIKQTTLTSDASGDITLLDFSLNENHLDGTGFPTSTRVLEGEVFDYSYLSPNFDEASTTEKVRVRGFLNQDIIDETPWAQTAPVYEIVKSEEPTDDVRFAIEFSLIDALNRDIISIFATLEALDNAIGNPELVFSPDYPDLDRMRDVYFNRLQEKLNFKAFFEFFRWFDTSIGVFIEQLIPRKTNFKGTNFVIESHMLERHKVQHHGSEMYLSDQERDRIRDVLLLQQVVGSARKY